MLPLHTTEALRGGRAYRGLQGWVSLNDSAPEHLSALRFLPRFLS
jgi:hypothetical protein